MDINRKLPFTVGEEMKQICQPLFDASDLTFFEYIKSYNNGSYITLCNNLDWLENYFTKQYYNVSYFRGNPKSYQKSCVFNSTLNKGTECIKDAIEGYGIDHVFSIIEPFNGGCEFFLFGTHPDNKNIVNFYINHLDSLRRFIYYFHEKAEPLLLKHEADKFKSPFSYVKLDDDTTAANDAHIVNKHVFKPSRYKINGMHNITLSQREVECIYWLSKGKTSFETGIILNLSQRTVEKHLNNAKEKFGCSRISRLLYLAQLYAVI